MGTINPADLNSSCFVDVRKGKRDWRESKEEGPRGQERNWVFAEVQRGDAGLRGNRARASLRTPDTALGVACGQGSSHERGAFLCSLVPQNSSQRLSGIQCDPALAHSQTHDIFSQMDVIRSSVFVEK